jgi:type I restriction enzyme R subunit
MVVSVDKATAVRMYDKVQKHWKKHLAYLLAELETCDAARRPEVEDKVRYMQETDMAVVVSQSQNEVEDIQKKGADITPHRKRMLAQDLDEKFKDAADPFRIVFVCAMWMTGFDVQSCSTIYLDKPMRNHTLMQTIARANRVFGDKNNGLIVDYIGVFRNLQQALAIYGSASGGGVQEGELPVMDKGALVESLRQAIADARAYCAELGVPLDELQAASGFQRVKLLDDAVEAILLNDESRRKYLLLAGDVDRLYKAILPDRAANEFAAVHAALAIMADKIRSDLPEADISDVMGEVEALLDKSVAAQPYVIRDKGEPYDLSKIDFDQLRAHFAEGHKRTEAEKLRGAIHARLLQMVRLNKSRMDYLDEY